MNTFWIAAIAGTFFLMIFSWVASIREKRYHGYPRFFAFESIFILVLLNVSVWFEEPSSFRQIISWIFLAASLLFAALGVLALRAFGKAEKNFERTTRLVEKGIYRFIRHPMYASLLYAGIGVFLKNIRPVTAAVLVVNVAACLITAVIEEGEMRKKFGGAYVAYMKKTKRFIPFLF